MAKQRLEVSICVRCTQDEFVEGLRDAEKENTHPDYAFDVVERRCRGSCWYGGSMGVSTLPYDEFVNRGYTTPEGTRTASFTGNPRDDSWEATTHRFPESAAELFENIDSFLE